MSLSYLAQPGTVWVCSCGRYGVHKDKMGKCCFDSAILCDEKTVEVVDGKVIKAWAVNKYV
jgi:hypothetical protein